MRFKLQVSEGALGWGALAAYVAAYDYWACKGKHQTLSQAYGVSMSHKWGRIPSVVITLVVLKHLLLPNVYPNLDPLNHLAERWRLEKFPHYNLELEITEV